jgi:hypothetical protein
MTDRFPRTCAVPVRGDPMREMDQLLLENLAMNRKSDLDIPIGTRVWQLAALVVVLGFWSLAFIHSLTHPNTVAAAPPEPTEFAVGRAGGLPVCPQASPSTCVLSQPAPPGFKPWSR